MNTKKSSGDGSIQLFGVLMILGLLVPVWKFGELWKMTTWIGWFMAFSMTGLMVYRPSIAKIFWNAVGDMLRDIFEKKTPPPSAPAV